MHRKNLKSFISILFIVILCICVFTYLSNRNMQASDTLPPDSSSLSVMVIDVGQGDSILVTSETGDTMLIDAGEKSSTTAIFEELDERGVTNIDILVATHPHADHIGGLQSVIESYSIGTIYMPDKKSNSKTFKNLMKAIDAHDIPIIEAYAGLSFTLGDAQCTIVSPDKNADEDANNESVTIFLDYFDTEFLFTGDMETEAEEAVLEAGYYIDADVLKIAHHGSSTGTTEEFLHNVSPDYAAISCGEDNRYGHPHKETITLLETYGLDPLRTDIVGDILFTSDGHDIQVVCGD